MNTQECCANLKKTILVSNEEGTLLGSTQQIFMDPVNKKLTSISFKENLFSRNKFIHISSVDRIGEDVIFIKSASDTEVISSINQPPGENLKKFQGMWVTTFEGEHIGHLTDLDFDRSLWTITELFLSNGNILPVNEGEVNFGKDEILVPSSILKTIKRAPAKEGFLSRTFGKETISEVSNSIKRAIKNVSGGGSKKDQKNESN